ncbi:MAG: tetratricopeptide repeat protein, partial [Sphingomicrobium sp.]
MTRDPFGRHLAAMATSADQHLARAMEAQRQGRPADVVREAEAALRLRADHPVAHNMLGTEAMARNDLAAARRHFEAAARADPKVAALWLNLAKAHRLGGDDHAERAALEKALETDQRNLMAHVRLAELHERRGEMGEATLHWSGVAQLAAEHV